MHLQRKSKNRCVQVWFMHNLCTIYAVRILEEVIQELRDKWNGSRRRRNDSEGNNPCGDFSRRMGQRRTTCSGAWVYQGRGGGTCIDGTSLRNWTESWIGSKISVAVGYFRYSCVMDLDSQNTSATPPICLVIPAILNLLQSDSWTLCHKTVNQ